MVQDQLIELFVDQADLDIRRLSDFVCGPSALLFQRLSFFQQLLTSATTLVSCVARALCFFNDFCFVTTFDIRRLSGILCGPSTDLSVNNFVF